ncbi:hypothetical protein WSM22_20760 [Cytophagales bacterium WSM2-2]|nr:hypothetical protein WSM22_20760 [Cytophagales bacterium WSM2-2]
MKKHLIAGLLAFAMLSCAQKKAEMEAADSTQAADQELVKASKDLYSDGRSKMVKTAECRFQVDDMKKSKEAIIASIKKYSGFVESSNLEFQNPILEEHLTIRVLNDYFEDLLNEIMTQAIYVNVQKVTAEDVSKQFVDLESRLNTKREVQKRYEEILRKKTGTLDELLKTERQIGELQEEIEATVSQINFLKEKVRYSTIKLEVYQIAERQLADAKGTSGLPKKFGRAFMAGLDGITDVLIGLTYLWPLILVGSAGVYIYWIRRKRKVVKEA